MKVVGLLLGRSFPKQTRTTMVAFKTFAEAQAGSPPESRARCRLAARAADTTRGHVTWIHATSSAR